MKRLARMLALSLLALAALWGVIVSAGCASRKVDYTRTETTLPDGRVLVEYRVNYENRGNDTSADEITVSRDADGMPVVHMTKYHSTDMTARATIELAKTIRAVASPGSISESITPAPAPGSATGGVPWAPDP